jgi:hypothetical protein
MENPCSVVNQRKSQGYNRYQATIDQTVKQEVEKHRMQYVWMR